MRRGLAVLLATSAIAWLTPSLFGQYPPYPYAPPVYGPPPMPYGYYPPQMPMPMPMPMQMPPQAPRVYVYGPLDPATAPTQPQPAPVRLLPDASTKPATAKPRSSVTPVQATDKDKKDFVAPAPKEVKTAPAPGTSSAPSTSSNFLPSLPFFGCADDVCDWPETGCIHCPDPRRPGHGQFLFDVGANILVPYPSPRTAYSTTTVGGPSSTNDFPHNVAAGPRVSFGYLAHVGWGIRANYWYLNSSMHQSASNADPATTIGIPLGTPFQFTSPSATLANGIGSDNYNFSQTLNINVADLEVLKTYQIMQTTVLFSGGARYARIRQSYSASQGNPGGANGLITVTQDQQDANATNTFSGWGPTVSLELIHALPRSNFSIYGNVRGSFLWGTDNFDQSLRTQNKTINVAGAANFIDTTNANSLIAHREATIGETEFGLQYGSRCGPCYIFIRAGANLQTWWNVGSPTTSNGNISFVGGTARVGISY